MICYTCMSKNGHINMINKKRLQFFNKENENKLKDDNFSEKNDIYVDL